MTITVNTSKSMDDKTIMSTANIQAISAVIITKNAADTLKATLDSLTCFNEVIILDNGSEDSTPDIASQYANVHYHTGTFEGFGPTKNKAVDLANNDWVFSIDADEILDSTVAKQLSEWSANTPSHHYGTIERKNYFLGKHIRRGGWGNDILVRLFNRTHYRFNHNQVHESVVVDKEGQKVKLQGALHHQAVRYIGQLSEKVSRYSELHHKTILAKGKTPLLGIIIIKIGFAFFRSYILQMGFLEGWRGFVIAHSNANGVFFKYMKAYTVQQTSEP